MYADTLPEEYLAVVERLADEPIDMMEINISCPNVNAGFLAFGQDAHNVEKLTAQIKKIAKAADHYETDTECNRYHRDRKGSRSRWSRCCVSDQYTDRNED